MNIVPDLFLISCFSGLSGQSRPCPRPLTISRIALFCEIQPNGHSQISASHMVWWKRSSRNGLRVRVPSLFCMRLPPVGISEVIVRHGMVQRVYNASDSPDLLLYRSTEPGCSTKIREKASNYIYRTPPGSTKW